MNNRTEFKRDTWESTMKTEFERWNIRCREIETTFKKNKPTRCWNAFRCRISWCIYPSTATRRAKRASEREREREHIKQEKKQKSWFRGWWLAYIFMANVYSTPPNPLRLCAAATRKASPPRAAATAATRSSTSVLRRPCRCAGSWAGASMRRRCESRRDWERGRLLWADVRCEIDFVRNNHVIERVESDFE